MIMTGVLSHACFVRKASSAAVDDRTPRGPKLGWCDQPAFGTAGLIDGTEEAIAQNVDALREQ